MALSRDNCARTCITVSYIQNLSFKTIKLFLSWCPWTWNNLHCLEHSFFEQIFNLYSNPFYFKTHEITYVAFMQVYFQWSNCHVCHYSTFSTSRPKWTRSWYPWSNTTLVIHDRSSAYTWTTSAFRLWRYCKNAWSCEMHSVMCPCYVII